MTATTLRDPAELGHALRRQRRLLGLTQHQLAARAGVDPKQISRIETAAHEPKLSTLLAVVAALELDLAIQPRGGGSSAPGIEDIF
ncbi:helix-turn-helix transcriptional regulator [Mangrovicoccus sp. HB161399]|uniref:helix-turn-helix transcriptional regulator n=1 Tax=Mangrovicoccus sp. HB161399 TaxID=2720392 RepID=UPI0015576364|nr:helix-turn-helix transcriptional regulator [Mangrovicoccus sp. HB161399]